MNFQKHHLTKVESSKENRLQNVIPWCSAHLLNTFVA